MTGSGVLRVLGATICVITSAEDLAEPWKYSEQGQPERAIGILKPLVEGRGATPTAVKLLAMSFSRASRRAEGIRYFAKLAKVKDSAKGLANYGIALLSDRPDALGAAAARCAQAEPSMFQCFELAGSSLTRNSGKMQTVKALERLVPIDLTRAESRLALSVFHLNWGNYKEAVRHAEAGEEIATRRGQKEVVAALAHTLSILHGLEENTFIAGQYRRRACEAALNGPDPGLAFEYCIPSAGPEREAALRDWIERAGLEHSYWTESALEHGLAGVLMNSGRLKEALAHNQRAIELRSRAGTGFGSSGLYILSAKLSVMEGDYAGAVSFLKDGIKGAGEDSVQVAHVTSELSSVYFKWGEVSRAIAAALKTSRLFRKAGLHWQAGAALSSIGRIYLSLGDLEVASRYFYESLRSARRFRDHDEVARISSLIAELYLAQSLPEKSEAVMRRADNGLVKDPAVKAHTLLLRAEASSRLGRAESAARSFAAAAEQTGKINDAWLQASLSLRLGRHHIRGGRLAKAEMALREGREVAERASMAVLLKEMDYELSIIARRRHQAGAELVALKQAADTLEGLRSNAPGPDFRQHLVSRNWPVYARLIDVLNGLASREPGTSYDFQALTYSERARSRALTEMLAGSRVEPFSSGRVSTLTAEQIRERFGHKGTAILYYSFGQATARAWAIKDGRMLPVALPPVQAVTSLVQGFRESISRRPNAASFARFRRPAQELYRMLIEPFSEILRDSMHITIVADGILHALPFEALMDGDGRFLIEAASITYVPSATVLQVLEQDPRPSAERYLLAIGNPDFGAARSSVAPAHEGAGTNAIAVAGLPGTEYEVRSIAAIGARTDTDILLGADATESRLRRQNMGQYRRIHIATHAQVDERVPANSAIFLSRELTEEEDGKLTLAEIAKLKLNADLVILSACKTGMGASVNGEGMVGFTRAFLLAGARRVLVTLWPVDDHSTARLMIELYSNLQAAKDASRALREAKLGMLGSRWAAYRHPYYWANFIAVGLR